MAPSDGNRVAQHYRDLVEINRLITSSLDPAVVLSTVAKQASRLVKADAAALLLRDEGILKIAAAHNLGEPTAEVRVPLGPGVMASIGELGRVAGFGEHVGVPLVLLGETIGVLAVYRRESGGPAGDDEELLAALADQAVIALENARNYHQSQAQAEALRESEARFRLALDEAPIGVALVGLDGRFLRVNNVLCEIVGYSSEELIRLTLQAITHPEDVETDTALAQQLARGEIPRYQSSKRYLRKDGAAVDILLSCSVVRSPDGAPLYLIAHVEDVTERKRAEERLHQAQERFELALKGADLGAWDWNIDTGEVIFNARWAEIRGFQLDEIKPHVDSWIAGIHPDDRSRVQNVVADHFAGRVADYQTEHRVQTRSGEWIWILDRGKIFARDEQGRPTRMVGTELDITERKRLEHSLHETYADLDRAQSVAKTGSWRLDVDRGVLTWSEENYRIFGIPPGTPMTYPAFLACVHPDDRAFVDRMWNAALRGEPYDIEHRLLVGGTVKWVREKADLQLDEHGALLGGIGITQDITERKQAEEAVRLLEAKSSGILAVSADAIVSIDENQRITLFNEGAEKIFGYSREEAIGAALALLLPERFRAIHRRHVDRFEAGREVARRMGERSMVIFGLRKNGEEFPADAAISKLEVDGKRILTVALRDITEQKRVESEQRFLAEIGPILAASLEYEDTLKRVAELAVKDLAEICIVDVIEETGDVRRLKVSRDPATAVVSELLARIPSDRTCPRLLRTTLETKQPVLMQRLSPEEIASLAQSEEYQQLFSTFEPRSIITVPLLAYEKLLGGIALVSSNQSRVYGPADVRMAEELARRAALSIANARLYRTAQRAIQARDDVLGIVAHDLRNPLNTVRLQAQLLHLQGTEAEGRSRKSAETIERAAIRMDRLIQDLLDVSRMEAGQLPIEQGRVPPQDVATDTVETQRVLAANASVDLQLELSPDLPEVWADRNRLTQVLENLVGNALKFTGPGGSIRVGAAPRAGEVVFWVRDTGVGMSIEELEHVFDRFWQARRGDRRGAGLGLPIAKGIVEAHGGRMWVESKVARGTTFYFTVPVASSVQASASAVAPSARQ